MNVVRPNCRIQFTAEDLAFILSVLGTKAGSADALAGLLADKATRDLILDDEALLRAVLERRDCLRVSPQLYFYILVRQVFRRSGILEREVADYVAEMLAEFSQAGRTHYRLPGQAQPTEYFFEMLAALQTADDTTRFCIRAHIGNYSLFLSGVFPERIRFRTERRGAPGLRYYEDLGRMNYRVASDHRLARKYDLDGIFNTLSERFQETRRALNDLGDRLLNLGDSDSSLDAVLRASFAPPN
jgi:hypothetical protein